ncbi:MAG: DEAD/DEAH box helicase [Clostridium sp.]|nr:MAG: DEAD/DEAH box helicase [Clostridium sp.]
MIAKALKENLDSILLVPEIALTPQMTSRFKARFGDLVAVMHSGLSPLEKYDEWRKITNGDAKIAVGARSAIFAPFKHLGLIIIDEAHEDSYIQDNNPRYDACVVASMRSQRHSCPLILGSATPKVCQYYKALNNEATLLVMNKRANNLSLPKTKIVSLVDELKAGNRSSLSLELQKEIIENLKK